MFPKNLISFRNKIRILLFLRKFQTNTYFDQFSLSKGRRIFVFLAADYGNLGDVAISYAQKRFLTINFPESQVVDIPISKTLEGICFVKNIIKKDDIITIIGGGNFGDLYEQIESLRQLVVENFNKNKIISFPQTMDFSSSQTGLKALKRAKLIYSKHPKFTFVAREAKTYSDVKMQFPNLKSILTPDIVLSLDKREPSSRRKGVVMCIRNDKEKRLTAKEQSEIYRIIETRYGSYEFYDTHIGRGNLTPKEQNEELEKIWSKFRGAELVITDRLHGMIFCFITNTPCIVFLNNNHKIQESFKWIESSDNIKIIDHFSGESLNDQLDKINMMVNKHIDMSKLYEILISEIKSS